MRTFRLLLALGATAYLLLRFASLLNRSNRFHDGQTDRKGPRDMAKQPGPTRTRRDTAGATLTGTPAPHSSVQALQRDADIEARRRPIAEAAYYRAQRRGFAPGYEEEDWLEAEKEIAASEEGSNADDAALTTDAAG
jgi:hypothetical protein